MRDNISRRLPRAVAAVDDQRVGGEVRREVAALHVDELEFAPTYCVSQRGIFTRPMSSPIGWCVQVSAMSTRSPAFEPVDGQRAAHVLGQVALEAGHQDRERGHRDGRRHVRCDLQEGLRVGDDKGRGRRRAGPSAWRSSRSWVTRARLSPSSRSRIAMHLRKDEAALRGFLVDRHDEQRDLARRHEVGHHAGDCRRSRQAPA